MYDQFIDLSGRLYISDQDGLVQTFITLEGGSIDEAHLRGGMDEYHYYTGVDRGPEAPPDMERRFPIAYSGELFVVAAAGYFVTALRLWESWMGGTEAE